MITKINNMNTKKHIASIPFEIQTHQGEEDEMVSCFIPAINTYFSAKSFDDVDRKVNVMIKIWVNYFNEMNRGKNLN